MSGVVKIDGWRVSLPDGEARAVEVRQQGADFWASMRPGGVGSCEPSPRTAIARLVASMGLDIAEILMPRQPSRAEIADTLAAVGHAVGAESCGRDVVLAAVAAAIEAARREGVEVAAKVAAECASEHGHTQATMFAAGRPEMALVVGIKGGEASRIEGLIRALKVAP